MSDSVIMSIQEMIDLAFGEADVNVVNFKLIQTVLFILARQLRLLERRVDVEIGPIYVVPSSSSLSVTEVKLKAAVQRKRKRIITTQQTADKKLQKPAIGKGTGKTGQLQTVGQKSVTEKSSYLEKSTTEMSSTERSTTDKTSTDKSSTTKTSTDKTASSKKSTTEKSSTEMSTTEKSTTDRTSTDKTSTDKTSSTDKTVSTDKSSTDKTATKSTTERSSSLISSTEKSSTERTSTDPSSSRKTTTTESTTTRTRSSTDRSYGDNRRAKFAQEFSQTLELIEEQRERELRSIHQRANSQEEASRTPTPMASVDTMDVQYEKLLIVERVPSGEAKGQEKSKTPRFSIVTQEQFDELTKLVHEIQEKFASVGKPELPENMQLMQELRRGASLTDAMAALQLSARLEAAESTLQQLMSQIAAVAASKGLNMAELEKLAAKAMKKQEKDKSGKTGKPGKSGKKKGTADDMSQSNKVTEFGMPAVEDEEEPITQPADEQVNVDIETVPKNLITYESLDLAMQDLQDNIMRMVTALTSNATNNAKSALKVATKLEGKLEGTINLEERLNEVEIIVAQYVEEINKMDINLSSQMSNYQEELTQMEHDLEAGLEALAEALANTGGDTTGDKTAPIAELNSHLIELQMDFENTNTKQRLLKETQNYLGMDLQALWKQIEILRESKSDRDEVTDALRDKAGLGALNGLVSLQQFNAVRGDFEKRIGAAYDKFNSQEMIWQKAIDDLFRELNEKADLIQVLSLRDEIRSYIQNLNDRITAMMEIVGEPRAAAIGRKIFHDTNCLSCSTPAHMAIEEPGTVPALPAFPKSSTRPPAIGAENQSVPKEDGDHAVCYPGQPIRHQIDPRAHICKRYCGGSHTVVQGNISRAPLGMNIVPIIKTKTTALGTDGRVYMVDEKKSDMRPCLPCHHRPSNVTTLTDPQEADTAPQDAFEGSGIPWEMSDYHVFAATMGSDATPPLPIDSD